jgi:hypothetical protein
MKLCVAVLAAGLAWAQPPDQPDMQIDSKTRDQVIENALDRLNRSYVYPEVAHKMADAIHGRQKSGEYAPITSSIEFARKLTDDLRAVSHDRHLGVNYSHEPIPDRAPGPPSPQDLEQMRKEMALNNFGFEKLELLPGNIGYLDLRGFNPAAIAGEKAAAAMNVLVDCDALIIDLRQNGGGDPAMVQLLASYLFGTQPVHLNDLYWRPSDSTTQWWTLAYVSGRRMPDVDVYVLTSHRTFSAAEEFTYDLQNLKRATIVGEVTGGGAHPGGGERLGDHFIMFVPSGRAINPVTHTDWEGTGVKPDIAVPAEKALKTANLIALKKIASKTSDERLKTRVVGLIADLEKELK